MTSAECQLSATGSSTTGSSTTSSASTLAAQLIVLAKAPVPGRVKTRLTPPFTPQEAAMLAEAALVDTLEAGASASFARHTLALDDQRAAPGTLRAELPARFEVSPQRGQGLDERIAAAFDDAYAAARRAPRADRHGHSPGDPGAAGDGGAPAGRRGGGRRVRPGRGRRLLAARPAPAGSAS